ncbi:SAM-dependent methyltransferase [Crossiella equi]|uniref:SAM-dependent methyltransferase n=1 Tax=Crossiella equi TaxID=130796 RepID=A0ABS5AEZ2_9PSEU|nr:SAM-dependent DNA methyltransferase [Crossiella equi]MBP2475153.1 SAM-dependent methyltransferase [Crossiella equi]
MPNNEFGDFQTPLPLARAVLATLPRRDYRRVLEPTCGTGTFLRAAAELGVPQRFGVEIQAGHAELAREHGQVWQQCVFDLHLGRDLPWSAGGELLVLGNPPWVTMADLTRFGSTNVPVKSNVRGLPGIAARTGESNFDVAEYIWQKLLAELAEHRPTIALLCKTQVARNLLRHCAEHAVPVAEATLRLIDSHRWFGANVDAGLLTLRLGEPAGEPECALYGDLDAEVPLRRFGLVDGRLVADVELYARTAKADGTCPVEWRQGIKHDATAVMELLPGPRTKAGKRVRVEDGHLHPLLKSSDLFHGHTATARHLLVVPQRHLGDNTAELARTAPKLWRYLLANAAALDGRRSAIYRGRPRFCVFGVGDYAFAPYKVAVSGMYKKAEFRLVGPIDGRPAVLDDTCYFLSFTDLPEAAVVTALLRGPTAEALLSALVFWDAKRPITKKLLQRIDLAHLLATADHAELAATAAALGEVPVGDTQRAVGALTARWAGLT